MEIAKFADDVRGQISRHLQSASVVFRGSFPSNEFDGYSDIDLQADVHTPLDRKFFVDLEAMLRDHYGPALIRYDPDYRENRAAQGLRVSFYDKPLFWRIDLNIASDRETEQKWPQPFPEWSEGNSALMNLVWAFKYEKRGKPDFAAGYLEAACKKLGREVNPYSRMQVIDLLGVLAERRDTDALLVERLRGLAISGNEGRFR
jgi:hypothetical protein